MNSWQLTVIFINGMWAFTALLITGMRHPLSKKEEKDA